MSTSSNSCLRKSHGVVVIVLVVVGVEVIAAVRGRGVVVEVVLVRLHHDLQNSMFHVRPCKIPDFGLLCDLVWSDPEPDTTGWGISDRGVSYTFGNDILIKMCKSLDIDLVCRAHQVVEDGYEFECNRKIVVRSVPYLLFHLIFGVEFCQLLSVQRVDSFTSDMRFCSAWAFQLHFRPYFLRLTIVANLIMRVE